MSVESIGIRFREGNSRSSFRVSHGFLCATGVICIAFTLLPAGWLLTPTHRLNTTTAITTQPALPGDVAPSSQTPSVRLWAGGHLLGFSADQMTVSSGRHTFTVEFAGAQHVQPQNFGPDSQGDIQSLGEVLYPNLWPGIDLRYRATPDGIAESVWRLQSGADASLIRLHYSHPLRLNADGSLSIIHETGTLDESAPKAWQELRGRRVPVSVAFTLTGEHDVEFSLGEHDPEHPVWIDPTLTWNSFTGGAKVDSLDAIAVGKDGKVIVVGYSSSSWGNPIRPFDSSNSDYAEAFVAALDSTGRLLWNTFLGASGSDFATAVSVDPGGDIYVTGYSYKTWGNPVRAFSGIYERSDVFLAKLTSEGGLVWNTFLGSAAYDIGTGIAVNPLGFVYVAGYSSDPWGSPVRTHRGNSDVFAAKLQASSGALVWNTFLSGPGSDSSTGIALGADGDFVITGNSVTSWGSPIRDIAGEADAFALKGNGNGELLWNTFLGGAGIDSGNSVALDSDGNIYVTGDSNSSWGSPLREFVGDLDAYAARLTTHGDLVWNTFLGAPGDDSGKGVAVSLDGKIFVAGRSRAGWGSPQKPFNGGNFDAFVAQLDKDGSLTGNTFLGGTGNDLGVAVAMDGNGIGYVGGLSDKSWGRPVRPFDDVADGFVAQFRTIPTGNENTLTVTKTAGGRITSHPAGIDCGSVCRATFSSGAAVALTTQPESGFTFSGWAGACSGSGNCNVTLDGDKTVSATFTTTPQTRTLTVNRSGSGTIASSPAGISCGSSCKGTFTAGTTVRLAPTADAGHRFNGWSDGCSGTGECVVTLATDQTISAQFVEVPGAKHLLKVVKVPNGLVTSDPNGIYCGGKEKACTALLSSVTLTAYPTPGYAVSGWVGCPGSQGPICSLTLTQPTKVKAVFTKLPKYKLRIAKSRNGLITSQPPGLKCGYSTRSCAYSFVSGTQVTLSATPKPGTSFYGWTGQCTGTGECSLMMDGNKDIGVSFQ